ncbi:MAG: hypothetical protein ABIO70_27875 [Pseudomonadota bacterium]
MAKVKAELTARGLDAPAEPRPQRVDLTPGGPRPMVPGGKLGQVPSVLATQRLGGVERPPPQPPEDGAEPEEAPAVKE